MMTLAVLEKKTPELVDWSEACLVEITLPKNSSYEKVREMLTRVGIASKDGKTLFQSCHILKMDGKLWVVHFKELFALRGNGSTFSVEDHRRRQAIISLMTQWNYIIPVVDLAEYHNKVDTRGIVVLQSSQKEYWQLEAKYSLQQD